ncbi:hypothetical protein IMSAGC008_02233 [Muribaculaceae bacterium]|nr:hypothetical protein IMSAGC008_02233 [Muribaculaceae bacterium]
MGRALQRRRLQPAVLRPRTLRRHSDARPRGVRHRPGHLRRQHHVDKERRHKQHHCAVCRKGRPLARGRHPLGQHQLHAARRQGRLCRLQTQHHGRAAHHGGLLAGAERQAVGRLVGRPRAPAGIPRHRGGVLPPREARRHIRGMAENPHRRQLRRHTRHPLPHGRHRPGGGRRENIPCQCHGEAPCHHRRLGKGLRGVEPCRNREGDFRLIMQCRRAGVCLCRLGRQRVAAGQ